MTNRFLSWSEELLSSTSDSARRLAFSILFFTALPVFYFINFSKNRIGDWEWYSNQYELYPYFALPSIFGPTFYPINDPLEPNYYVSAWVISRLTDGDLRYLIFFILLATYGVSGFATYIISRSLELTLVEALTLLLFIWSFGINAALVTHLVRQQIAMALLLASFAKFVERRFSAGLALTFAAILTHTPSLVLGFFLVLGVYLEQRKPAALLAILGVMIPAGGLLFAATYGARYQGESQGSPNFLNILLLIGSLIFLLAAKGKETSNERFVGILLMPIVFQGLFVLGVLSEPVVALRLFLYLDHFVAVVLGWTFIVICRRIGRPRSEIQLAGAFLLAGGAIAFRIWVSPLV